MRIYELTIILEPNLDKETVNSELDKLTDMVKKANGTVFEVQHLGMRRLTYEITGNTQGNFYTIYFNAVPDVLIQMDKSMKLNESVIRSMTIVLKQSIYEASKKKKSDDERPSAPIPRKPMENKGSDDDKPSPEPAKPTIPEVKLDEDSDEKSESKTEVVADDSADDQEKEA